MATSLTRRLRLVSLGAVTAMLATLVALAGGEGLIRVLVPRAQWVFRDASNDWQADATLGWIQRPHLDVEQDDPEFGWRVRFATNSDGLQPSYARRERAPGALRVLIVGDSTVVGRSVPEDKRLHVLLCRQLSARFGRVEVFNAGVEGYSTDQALLQILRLAPLYRPDIIVYGFCSNDLGGNEVSVAYGTAKPRYSLQEGQLQLHPPLKNAIRIQPYAAGWRSWLQYSALYRYLRPLVVAVRQRFGEWEQRNLSGMDVRLYHDPETLRRADWVLLGALLREMRGAAERNHSSFLFFSHPAAEEVWQPTIEAIIRKQRIPATRYDRLALQRRLADVALEENVAFCPLIESFLAQPGRGPFHLLPRNPHSNPAGYQLVAETLAASMGSPRVLDTSEARAVSPSPSRVRRERR